MQTYKAPDNSLHAIYPAFAHLLPPGCVAISEEEADELRAEALASAPEQIANEIDPIEKLKSFLSSNPDVAALLGGNK